MYFFLSLINMKPTSLGKGSSAKHTLLRIISISTISAPPDDARSPPVQAGITRSLALAHCLRTNRSPGANWLASVADRPSKAALQTMGPRCPCGNGVEGGGCPPALAPVLRRCCVGARRRAWAACPRRWWARSTATCSSPACGAPAGRWWLRAGGASRRAPQPMCTTPGRGTTE